MTAVVELFTDTFGSAICSERDGAFEHVIIESQREAVRTPATVIEMPHVGLDGRPCRCTPDGRRRATRGCAATCPCHGVAHTDCPRAKPCIGGCGRRTTAHETTSCGYCVHCAADQRWRPVL